MYDPRVLLTGSMDAIGKWRGGLFDQGSFVETLAGAFTLLAEMRECWSGAYVAERIAFSLDARGLAAAKGPLCACLGHGCKA